MEYVIDILQEANKSWAFVEIMYLQLSIANKIV